LKIPENDPETRTRVKVVYWQMIPDITHRSEGERNFFVLMIWLSLYKLEFSFPRIFGRQIKKL
jgi:hypothetical protein